MSEGVDRNEALEILKLSLDDIDRIKQQQWRDFYTVLAVQAGLLVLSQDHLSLRWLFIALSLVGAVLGAVLIKTSQHSLEQKFRARKNRALAALGKDFTAMWGGQDDPDELEQREFYPNTCLLVLGIGTAMIILVMIKSPPAMF